MAAPNRSPSRGFTPKFIESLTPLETEYELGDRRASGLRLRVTPKGAKVFRWYFTERTAERSRWRVATIGPWSFSECAGRVTLAQAREWLGRLKDAHVSSTLPIVLAELASQLRPSQRGVPVRPAPDVETVRTVSEDFYKRRILPHRKRPEAVRSVLDRDILPVIGDRPIATLSTRECAAAAERVVDRGAKVHAGKVLGTLKQLCRYAQARGYTDRNPAAPLDPLDLGIVTNVDSRWLTDEEIPLFWNALDASGEVPQATPGQPRCSIEGCGGPRFAKGLCAKHYRRVERTGQADDPVSMAATTRAGLKLLLLTGVRSGELLSAEWKEINWDEDRTKWARGQTEPAPTWTIPPSHSKYTRKQEQKAKPFVVPLGPTAVSLFRELERVSGKSQWVMNSAHADAGHFTEKAIGRAMRRMFQGSPPALTLPGGPASPHDLRRTMRTHLGKLRVPLHVVERCLNHSLGRIVQTYDQGDYIEERREALLKWDAYVARLLAPETSNVAFLSVAGGAP